MNFERYTIRFSEKNIWHGKQNCILIVQSNKWKKSVPYGGFLRLCYIRSSMGNCSGFSKDSFHWIDSFAVYVSRNTFRGGNILQQKLQKKFGHSRRTSATFAVLKFYLSEAFLWDELRLPKNAIFFERCMTSGKSRTFDESFSAGVSKTIPRVSAKVLRKDFILANVFYFGSLSDF